MGYVTSAQRQDVIVIGDVATDIFLRLPDKVVTANRDETGHHLVIPFGGKVLCDKDATVAAGGDAANAAVAFARLGLRVALASFLAHDQFGRDLLVSLRTEGISTNLVHMDDPAETNRNYILWFGSDRTILVRHQSFNYHWPHLRPSEVPAWIYLTSVGENALAYEHQILEWLGENPTVKLAFRPGTAQLEAGLDRLAPLCARADVLIIGDDDARRLVGGAGTPVEALLDALVARGPERVVVPRRDGGALAEDRVGRYRVDGFPDPTPVYERTGADDAFAATVVAGLVAGRPLEVALRRAPVNAMSVTHEIGAQAGLLREDELEASLAEAPASFVVETLTRPGTLAPATAG
jgi:sugar/nucleoside kinase (ribokinase family)